LKDPRVAFPTGRILRFVSGAVEDITVDFTRETQNPLHIKLFENYHPNTFGTRVQISVRNGKPDALIVTSDIAAMWLRDYIA
jgi:hypothetical protein